MEFFTVIMCLAISAIVTLKVIKAVRKAFPVSNTSETRRVGGREQRNARQEKMQEGEEYFSYENVPGNSCFTEEATKPKRERQSAPRVQDVDGLVQGVDFDLRQAVIYNTILENKYIEEKF